MKTGYLQRYITASNWLQASGAMALGAMLVTLAIGTPSAKAQTYTVLHSFNGTDGQYPMAGLIRDEAGNLYGTTEYGGAQGYGVVFRLDKTGETVVYSFTGGTDGRYPVAGLTRDSTGNLYGTTQVGGASDLGIVFMVDTTGAETVLHSFTGGTDGAFPWAGLIQNPAGHLYGTAESGGSPNAGVVFKLDTTGTETVLHTFRGADGDGPYAGLTGDSAGNFYGTTAYGGTVDKGVVFKLDKAGETVLHSFTDSPDGAYPYSGVIPDPAGNLYGTTVNGGLNGGAQGYGAAFMVDTTGTEKVLYSFSGGADGAFPHAGLIRDPAGNLYGTTAYGGVYGYGVVFKLDATGMETVLYSFTGGTDGANPVAGLIADSEGNLYGTTVEGGSGNGVVFKLHLDGLIGIF